MNIKKLRFCLLPLIASVLAACNSGSGGGQADLACAETGPYACQTGDTEPLYTFQWALNYAASYFKDFPDVFGGGLDLNVEPVHRMGIKGQGVNVLVLDTGTDLHNEDLAPNADYSMSWNFVTQQDDPYPDLNANSPAHGTVVAGIIAAAQNGKGVMGIAPRATIGGANYLSGQSQVFAAYGGAPWSGKADVFNASFGGDTVATPYESDIDNDTTTALRGIKNLRNGKGAIFVKAAGNSFNPGLCGRTAAYFDCTNPANDVSVLESNVITVAALNAKGSASSYSSAGSVVWVTGLGGEYGGAGNYGEGSQNGDGPTIFSTDLRGCIYGFSYTGAETPFLRGQTVRNGRPDNPDCDYTYMNGTSAATPTIAGVVALMLDANPALTWRDVRDILRISSRKVDADYLQHIPRKGDKPYGSLEDLATNQPTGQMGSAADIHDGAVAFPMDLGWQKNAAGYEYSNWYGFGVPDTEKAVELARQYKSNPSLSRAKDVQIPDFSEVAYWQLDPLSGTETSEYAGANIRIGAFPYQRVTSLGTFKAGTQIVDQLQVRLSGEDVCLGSLGIAAKSPSGTVSLLKLPNDHFKANGIDSFNAYTLGSFAFYGEQAQGDWELFAIAANPDTQIEVVEIIDNQVRTRLSTECPSTDGSGGPIDFKLLTEARIIAQ
ncbi:MAG TPA: S8 family serine peptidase [Eoetvoesiella sp.]|uniref:S8 family serine peptidase n=1 Tax=Eoetvoesiella sp. TaxID=1966355 RepID=UPI002BEDF13C|nr:S8 family serine peptidase [Eoetvoesiella sp.]HWK60342.1 S8 family serine peptidase [Eoetvoesiella sp.]